MCVLNTNHSPNHIVANARFNASIKVQGILKFGVRILVRIFSEGSNFGSNFSMCITTSFEGATAIQILTSSRWWKPYFPVGPAICCHHCSDQLNKQTCLCNVSAPSVSRVGASCKVAWCTTDTIVPSFSLFFIFAVQQGVCNSVKKLTCTTSKVGFQCVCFVQIVLPNFSVVLFACNAHLNAWLTVHKNSQCASLSSEIGAFQKKVQWAQNVKNANKKFQNKVVAFSFFHAQCTATVLFCCVVLSFELLACRLSCMSKQKIMPWWGSEAHLTAWPRKGVVKIFQHRGAMGSHAWVHARATFFGDVGVTVFPLERARRS